MDLAVISSPLYRQWRRDLEEHHFLFEPVAALQGHACERDGHIVTVHEQMRWYGCTTCGALHAPCRGDPRFCPSVPSPTVQEYVCRLSGRVVAAPDAVLGGFDQEREAADAEEGGSGGGGGWESTARLDSYAILQRGNFTSDSATKRAAFRAADTARELRETSQSVRRYARYFLGASAEGGDAASAMGSYHEADNAPLAPPPPTEWERDSVYARQLVDTALAGVCRQVGAAFRPASAAPPSPPSLREEEDDDVTEESPSARRIGAAAAAGATVPLEPLIRLVVNVIASPGASGAANPGAEGSGGVAYYARLVGNLARLLKRKMDNSHVVMQLVLGVLTNVLTAPFTMTDRHAHPWLIWRADPWLTAQRADAGLRRAFEERAEREPKLRAVLGVVRKGMRFRNKLHADIGALGLSPPAIIAVLYQ